MRDQPTSLPSFPIYPTRTLQIADWPRQKTGDVSIAAIHEGATKMKTAPEESSYLPRHRHRLPLHHHSPAHVHPEVVRTIIQFNTNIHGDELWPEWTYTQQDSRGRDPDLWDTSDRSTSLSEPAHEYEKENHDFKSRTEQRNKENLSRCQLNYGCTARMTCLYALQKM